MILLILIDKIILIKAIASHYSNVSEFKLLLKI